MRIYFEVNVFAAVAVIGAKPPYIAILEIS